MHGCSATYMPMHAHPRVRGWQLLNPMIPVDIAASCICKPALVITKPRHV